MRIHPLAASCLLLAGCASVAPPKPSYRNVDTQSLEYTEAVARQVQTLEAKGVSASDAAKKAPEQVVRREVAEEKARRLDEIAPLLAAVNKTLSPKGAWAFTLKLRFLSGGVTSLYVMRFDPSRDEGMEWNLDSKNGVPPTDEEQRRFRKNRATQSKTEQTWVKTDLSVERLKQEALFGNLTVDRPEGSSVVLFSINRQEEDLAIHVPPRRTTYTVDSAGGTLLRRTYVQLAPFVAAGDAIQILESERSTDYRQVDPDGTVLPSAYYIRSRAKVFGRDSGEQETSAEFTDYHRVRSRHPEGEVVIGEPTLSEFAP